MKGVKVTERQKDQSSKKKNSSKENKIILYRFINRFSF